MLWKAKLLGAAGLALAVCLAPIPAEAQVTATVVLKDGQRHTGQNLGYRVDEREVAVRTSPGEEPRVPADQVAYVDFGGTADRPVQLSGTQHAVVLRDGNVLRGQVIEMGHVNRADQTTPYYVTFRTEAGEERRFDVKQVGRVYFSDPGRAAVATTGQEAPPGATTVPANRQWTPTGVIVRQGERITFRSTGQIQIDQAGTSAGPSGIADRRAANAPMPDVFLGALIARVGDGQPFHVGNQDAVTMPASGQLFIGVNDDIVADNSGEFHVTLDRAAMRRR